MTSKAKELYFAFGSNMNPARMILRKAFFTSRVPATLHGYSLGFSFNRSDGFGSANITPDPNGIVHGALYTLEGGGLEKLDFFEGVAKGYYRRQNVVVRDVGGKEVEVTTYIVTGEYFKEGLKPKQEYLDHLLAGKDILPADYYETIKALSEMTCE